MRGRRGFCWADERSMIAEVDDIVFNSEIDGWSVLNVGQECPVSNVSGGRVIGSASWNVR